MRKTVGYTIYYIGHRICNVQIQNTQCAAWNMKHTEVCNTERANVRNEICNTEYALHKIRNMPYRIWNMQMFNMEYAVSSTSMIFARSMCREREETCATKCTNAHSAIQYQLREGGSDYSNIMYEVPVILLFISTPPSSNKIPTGGENTHTHTSHVINHRPVETKRAQSLQKVEHKYCVLQYFRFILLLNHSKAQHSIAY